MVGLMQTSSTSGKSKPATILNREKLDELRRANSIKTEAALAKVIGVRVETLWRATNGYPVSGGFIAGVKMAFPHASMDSLFDVVMVEALAS